MTGTEQDFTASKVIMHPAYHKPIGMSHDIALLKLNRPAVLTRYVHTLICSTLTMMLIDFLPSGLSASGETGSLVVKNVYITPCYSFLFSLNPTPLCPRWFDPCQVFSLFLGRQGS